MKITKRKKCKKYGSEDHIGEVGGESVRDGTW